MSKDFKFHPLQLDVKIPPYPCVDSRIWEKNSVVFEIHNCFEPIKQRFDLIFTGKIYAHIRSGFYAYSHIYSLEEDWDFGKIVIVENSDLEKWYRRHKPDDNKECKICLLYTSPSPRDRG